ncbi:MAG: 50S ribosomal protein L9 [Oceanidesulfovibrio sp.]
MKLILRADVDNLGSLGDIVTVKPGYGRNYLVPQGLAMPASDSNLKVFEQERKKLQAKMDSAKGEAQDIATKAADADIVIEVRVGENNRLYGSVTANDIANAISAATGVDDEKIDRRKLLLDEPIRALGFYEVPFRPYPGVEETVTVKVIRFGGTVEEVEELEAQRRAEEAGETLAAMGGEEEAPAEEAAEAAVVEEEEAAPTEAGTPGVTEPVESAEGEADEKA